MGSVYELFRTQQAGSQQVRVDGKSKSDHGNDNFTPGMFLLKIPEGFNDFT
jgi:hypothetical protein